MTDQTQKREYGFYWVKYNGGWEIALFCPWRNLDHEVVSMEWSRIGDLWSEFQDSDFEDIHPEKIQLPGGLSGSETEF